MMVMIGINTMKRNSEENYVKIEIGLTMLMMIVTVVVLG